MVREEWLGKWGKCPFDLICAVRHTSEQRRVMCLICMLATWHHCEGERQREELLKSCHNGASTCVHVQEWWGRSVLL